MTRTTPRFCYVVLCHTDAANVLRLARRIRELSPTAAVLLRHHQDGFITADQAREAGADLLRSRITVTWGGWSMTAAAIEAFEHARATVDPDHCVLVSGQCYPVRDLAAWEAEVTASGADALLDPMDDPLHSDHYEYVWVEPFHVPRWVPAQVDRAAAFVTGRIDPFIAAVGHCYRNRRDHAWHVGVRRPSLLWGGRPPVPLVKGSFWMTLSRRGVDAVLQRHHGDRALRRFFTTTEQADEMYVHSVLADDPTVRVVERPTSYARFAGGTSPVPIDLDELAAAARTRAPFARKVPAGADDVRAEADRITGSTSHRASEPVP